MRFSILIFILSVTLGCSTKKMQVDVPIESPEAFSTSGVSPMPNKWWQAFNEPALNSIVDSALSNNFDLYTAWYRLQAAKALVNRASSSFFPSISAMLQGSRGKSLNQYSPSEQYQFSLMAEYELDLWGKIRSRVEAEKYRAKASRADYHAATISLTAEITSTWFQLVAARSQLRLIKEQIETNQKSLQSLKARFGSGQIRSVDILRQQQLLESTREQKNSIETDIALLANKLTVLSGKNPWIRVDSVSKDLPELPPFPETGIPVDRVQNRPDVQEAFYRLQASDRDLASAISNRYPRISFSTSLFSSSGSAEDLFTEWAHNIAGDLLAPIVYGGELKAEVDRNEAIKNQYLYAYGQTVLSAFREVEDAIVLEQKQERRRELLEQQHDLALASLEQLRVGFFNGVNGYLDVLTAQREEQQLRRELINARLLLLEYRVALYRALASSFETERALNDN